MAALISRPQYENLSPYLLKKKIGLMASKDIINRGMIPPWGGKTKNLLVFNDPPAHEEPTVEDEFNQEL